LLQKVFLIPLAIFPKIAENRRDRKLEGQMNSIEILQLRDVEDIRVKPARWGITIVLRVERMGSYEEA
jgi:hypothetical protein